MLNILLMVTMLILAIQAIRAERLLHATICLAGVSALLSVVLFQLGAPHVAVIELSVGSGLVTVLFVFAIGIAGEEELRLKPLVPRPVAWGLVIAAVLLLGWQIKPFSFEAAGQEQDQTTITQQMAAEATLEEPIQFVIWEQRGLDALIQVVLIFSGVLGLLGLLAEAQAPLGMPVAREIAAGRDRELSALEEKVMETEKELR